MPEIVTATEVAHYAGVAESDFVTLVTELANGLVEDKWRNPVDPIPAKIRAIALEVAARPARNPKALQSWTRSIDDASRTERAGGDPRRAGVYLTDDEKKVLLGRRRRRATPGVIGIRAGHMPALPYEARSRRP